jgi:hypothetical protein
VSRGRPGAAARGPAAGSARRRDRAPLAGRGHHRARVDRAPASGVVADADRARATRILARSTCRRRHDGVSSAGTAVRRGAAARRGFFRKVEPIASQASAPRCRRAASSSPRERAGGSSRAGRCAGACAGAARTGEWWRLVTAIFVHIGPRRAGERRDPRPRAGARARRGGTVRGSCIVLAGAAGTSVPLACRPTWRGPRRHPRVLGALGGQRPRCWRWRYRGWQVIAATSPSRRRLRRRDASHRRRPADRPALGFACAACAGRPAMTAVCVCGAIRR